jgi:non-specific serine/threonine protein kinase
MRLQALRQYEKLERVLRDEVGAVPESSTRQLYEEISSGRAFPSVARAETQPSPSGTGARTDTSPHNLARAALTSFVGREQEMVRLRELLDTSRLVTAVGAGGSGKTRLALEVAGALTHRVSGGYSGGVWLVELAALGDGELVERAVAETLDVREQAEAPVLSSLTDALGDQRLLLVLDNCEHVAASCARIAEALLTSCPNLQILATSREALRVPGEVIFVVPPMRLPGDTEAQTVESLGEVDSVKLLVDRVRYRQPAFVLTQENARAVIQICRRVDGIPLAIELAAARAGVMSIEQIADRLKDALRLLAGGSRTADARQQTLRQSLDWSYDLLDDDERFFLDRLSVFSGGWSLEAAEAIIPDTRAQRGPAGRRRAAEVDALDVLSRLVDKSLVLAEMGSDGRIRYRLLEPVRQYAWSHLVLDTDQARETQLRHAAYFLGFAEIAGPNLVGPDQALWYERLETEHDNLRAVLSWSRTADAEPAGWAQAPEVGLRLAAILWRLWNRRGYLREGREWLESLLAVNPNAPAKVRADALRGAGHLAYIQADNDRAQVVLEEGLHLYRELRDDRGIIFCLGELAAVAMNRGDYSRSAELDEEVLDLSRKTGNRYREASSLSDLGIVARLAGDLERAQALMEEGLAIYRELDDSMMIAVGVCNLGMVARDAGKYVEAARFLSDALTTFHRLSDRRFAAAALEIFAELALLEGRSRRGARIFGAADALRRASGSPISVDYRSRYQMFLEQARTSLGYAFDSIWNEGQTMTRDEAVAYALVPDRWEDDEVDPRVWMTRGLTRRESEVAPLILRGLTNRQIAAELGIAERTVDTHVGNILSKLGLTSRTHLAEGLAREQSVPAGGAHLHP